MSKFPRLLMALPGGAVVEHPVLLAPVRSGDDTGVFGENERPIPLPKGGSLSSLPGQRPVGIDPETGETVVLREVKVDGQTLRPDAVAAVLPPGYTRTYLPVGHRTPLAPQLPQWAYTAAGWDDEQGFVVHALHTDTRDHWSPDIHSTPDLADRVAKLSGESTLYAQLAKCALEYRCFTAQHVFYERDEGAIPASVTCNARCVGCISAQEPDEGVASHDRMDGAASAEDMAALGIHHLSQASETADGRVMVSFGQGCEGEPLTRYKQISEAIRLMRAKTDRGSININTNASLPKALEQLVDAGLDAVRVSLNSARAPLYSAYYRPIGYSFDDVRDSLAIARDRGLYIALNLLSFPGVTDREEEVQALESLVREFGVHQVQTRNLALDPDQYMALSRDVMGKGDAVGMDELIRRLKKARPGLIVGNYARGLGERAGWTKGDARRSVGSEHRGRG